MVELKVNKNCSNLQERRQKLEVKKFSSLCFLKKIYKEENNEEILSVLQFLKRDLVGLPWWRSG